MIMDELTTQNLRFTFWCPLFANKQNGERVKGKRKLRAGNRKKETGNRKMKIGKENVK